MRGDAYALVPVNLPAAALERELGRVEEAIAALTESDGFVEELIALHARRKALLAALQNRSVARPRAEAQARPRAPYLPSLAQSETRS